MCFFTGVSPFPGAQIRHLFALWPDLIPVVFSHCGDGLPNPSDPP
jgi:hypothetical protein